MRFNILPGQTASHAVDHGFRTILIEDATRGVSLDGIAKMRHELAAKGVYFAESHQVDLFYFLLQLFQSLCEG